MLLNIDIGFHCAEEFAQHKIQNLETRLEKKGISTDTESLRNRNDSSLYYKQRDVLHPPARSAISLLKTGFKISVTD